jgi:hypothetical protein
MRLLAMRRAWLLAAPLALVSITPARAADSWLVTEVHGAVLALVGDEWREVNSGDRISSGVAIRTLQAGSARLRHAGEVIGLGANTVVRPRATGGRPILEQYTGVVTLLRTGRGGSRVVMPEAGATGASATPPAILYVRGGEAHLTVGGRRLLLKAGQGYSSQGVWEGLTTADAKGGGPPAAVPAGPAGVPAPAAGPPPAGSAAPPGNATAPGGATPPGNTGAPGNPPGHDNGVGNGGTPGNGGQNGNGNNGNGNNGNGNGNAGNGGSGNNGHGGGNGNSGKGPK